MISETIYHIFRNVERQIKVLAKLKFLVKGKIRFWRSLYCHISVNNKRQLLRNKKLINCISRKWRL